jgi:hypothetical protein
MTDQQPEFYTEEHAAVSLITQELYHRGLAEHVPRAELKSNVPYRAYATSHSLEREGYAVAFDATVTHIHEIIGPRMSSIGFRLILLDSDDYLQLRSGLHLAEMTTSLWHVEEGSLTIQRAGWSKPVDTVTRGYFRPITDTLVRDMHGAEQIYTEDVRTRTTNTIDPVRHPLHTS